MTALSRVTLASAGRWAFLLLGLTAVLTRTINSTLTIYCATPPPLLLLRVLEVVGLRPLPCCAPLQVVSDKRRTYNLRSLASLVSCSPVTAGSAGADGQASRSVLITVIEATETWRRSPQDFLALIRSFWRRWATDTASTSLESKQNPRTQAGGCAAEEPQWCISSIATISGELKIVISSVRFSSVQPTITVVDWGHLVTCFPIALVGGKCEAWYNWVTWNSRDYRSLC